MYYIKKIGLLSVMVIVGVTSYSFAIFGFGSTTESVSSFIPANSIDNTSVLLAQNAIDIFTIDTQFDTNEDLTTQYNQLLSYNIVDAIKSSTNKPLTVSQHLQSLTTTASMIDKRIQSYQARAQSAQSILDQCTSEKQSADGQVLQAVNDNKLGTIDILINDSIKAGTCVTQNRIMVNAYGLIITKNITVSESLTKKSSIIQKYQSILITYPEVIADPAILTELNNASIQL